MRKKIPSMILATLIVFGVFGVFGQPALAAPEEDEEASVGLSGFLSEMEIEFEDYLALMASIADTGGQPHFLEENKQRYEAYRLENPDVPFDKVIAYVNANIDTGFYIDIQEVPNLDDVSLLVNKNFSLPPDWIPDDFVNTGGGHMMREEASEHFNLMRDAMIEDGLKVYVIITYRSYSAQRNTHGNAVSQHGSALADRNWARAGHSEHQTGLAADILHKSFEKSMHNAKYQNTKEFEWLTENAYNYGFILRYPDEYKDLHGYVFEPWHWRYVGVDVATAMHNEGIALFEEFYGRYLAPGVLDKAREFILEQRSPPETEEEEEIAEDTPDVEVIEEPPPDEDVGQTAATAEPVIPDSPDPPEPVREDPVMRGFGVTFFVPLVCIALGSIVVIRKRHN